jgi:hypothetical protein
MSNTGNRYLYGTEFTNITVVANCDNTEDGSIEASGTLFVNTIKEYDILSSGVVLEDSIFAAGKAIITSTETSLNISTAALIVYGGISIIKDARYYGAFYLHNTDNSNDLSSGSFIIDGGGSILKNLNVGGILTLYNSSNSINSSIGSLVSLGGISIMNTTDALSITCGGGLTVAGGASIEKTLFANLLISNNATIGNSHLVNITNNNLYSSNVFIQNLTSSNIISSNITATSLVSNYLEGEFTSISNLNLTYGTISNVYIDTQFVTNSTITNLYTNRADINTVSITQGIIENLTVGNLHVNTNIEHNDIVTNLSTSNIISQHVTIANLLFTYGTFANLYGNELYTENAYVDNLTVPNLISTHISTSNLSSYNIKSVNATATNIFTSNATIASILSSNVNTINSTIENLYNTNLTSTNIQTTNLTSANIVNINASSLYTTTGYLNLTGTLPSFNSSTGTFISYGGISIDIIENATSITSGGGLTIAGGASIAKDVYIGYTLFVPNISSSNISSIYGTVSHLLGTNLNYINSTFNNLYLTATTPSINSSSGAFISFGGVSIDCIEDVTSVTSGGGLTIAGGASIAKSLIIGDTISSSTVTTGVIYAIGSTINNILNTNITSTNGLITNISNTNLITSNVLASNINATNSTITNGLITNISSNNLHSTDIYYTTLNGTRIYTDSIDANYISNNISLTSLTASVSNLISTKSTIQNLYLTNGTFGSLIGSYIDVNNASISSLFSTNMFTTNETITNLLASNIRTITLIGTTSSFLYSSISNLFGTNSNFTNSTVINFNVSNITSNYIISDSITTSTLHVSSGQFINQTSTFNTFGSIYVTSTVCSLNSTSASIIVNGGISIQCTANATSYTSGGGVTIDGGLGISKDVYIGGSTWISGNLDLNYQRITNVKTPSNSLDVANKYYVDSIFNQYTVGNVSGNFTQGQVIIATTGGNITGYSEFMYDINQGSLYIYSTNDATSVSQGGSLQVSGGASIDKNFYVGGNAHVLGILDMNNQKITSVAIPTTYYDAANKYYVDNRFNEFTIGNVSGNFTQGQVIVASTRGNITGFESFTFFNNTLSVFTTDEATSLTYGGVLSIAGGARIAKSLYIGGPVLQIPTGDILARPINASGGAIRYNTETQQFEGFGAGDNWGSLGGVVDIAQTTKILASASPSTTDGNLYFYTIGNERVRINSSGNVGIGTSAPSSKLTVNGDLLVTGGINAGGQIITNVTAPTLGLDVVNKWYLDQRFEQYTIGNVSGNFTQGQVIVASTEGNITGFESFTFYDNTLNIFTTDEVTSLTSGGVLSIAGGARIAKGLYIGGGVDVGGQLITNVTSPSFDLDVVNKWYLDKRFNQYTIGNVSGNFTQGQVIIASTEGNIIGLESFTFFDNTLSVFTTDEATSLTNGGVLSIAGGARIAKSLYIGGPVLQIPTGDISTRPINAVAGTVRYNSETQQFEGFGAGDNWGSLGGVVDIAQTTKIVASESPSTTDGNLYFYTVGDERVRINSSGNVGIGTSAPSSKLTVNGDLLVTGGINAGGQIITNVTAPTLGLDVVNKWYLDNRLNQYTIGNVNGNFTQGQVIIASAEGNITGYNSFTFDGTKLSLYTTENAIGLTSGGVLNVDGGARIVKDVYIGGKLDVNLNNITNVQDPYQDYDAVNKRYIDKKFDNIFSENNDIFFEYDYELNNNVTVPQNIPKFIIPSSSKAFIANVYVKTSNTCSIYTLRGLKGSIWKMASSFVGGNTNDVDFYINNNGVDIIIQYTNNALQGLTTISYRITNLIDDVASFTQINNSLSPNTTSPQDIFGLSFPNFNTNAIKLIMYVSSNIDTKYSLVTLNAVLKNNTWDLNTSYIGNVDTINFNIESLISSGQVQYTNSSSASDYIIRVKKIIVDNVPFEYTLNANMLLSSNIDKLDTLLGDYINTYFLASVYVYFPIINKYSFYEIEGVFINNTWSINTRFIGDNTGIFFSIISTSLGNYLAYTNPNNVDGYIRLVNANPFKSALPISKGGTSTTYLNEYAVLRGNGLNKILGTGDLIYKDYKLTLGQDSSILLNSTQDAINLTSGTLVTYGGISINKNLRVGEGLIVNNVNMTPLSDDIISEIKFEAANNQIIPQNVNRFKFSNNTKSFNGTLCISIISNNETLDCLYDIKGLRKSSGWVLCTSYIGDNVKIVFSITSDGQLQYTSSNINDWLSTIMKFRVLTTSI